MNCYSTRSSCFDKDTSWYLFQSEWKDFEKVCAGFYLAAVLSLLIAFIMVIMSLNKSTDPITAGIFASLSAFCSLVAVLVWGAHWTKQIRSRQVYPAWAYILAVLQMLLSLVGGILCVINRRKIQKY